MTDQRRDAPDLGDRRVDAVDGIQQFDTVAKLFEHLTRRPLGVAASQDQVRVEIDHLFGIGNIVAEGCGGFRCKGHQGVGRIDR